MRDERQVASRSEFLASGTVRDCMAPRVVVCSASLKFTAKEAFVPRPAKTGGGGHRLATPFPLGVIIIKRQSVWFITRSPDNMQRTHIHR